MGLFFFSALFIVNTHQMSHTECTPLFEFFKECQEEDFDLPHIQNPNWVFFMNRINNQDAEIFSSGRQYPFPITTIEIKVKPQKEVMYLYSIFGIETIFQSLFQNPAPHIKKELVAPETFLKVFLEKDPLYTIPILNLHIYILSEITNGAMEFLKTNLFEEVFTRTHSKGIIWTKDVYSERELAQTMKMPVSMGSEPFTSQNIPSSIYLHPCQLQEMNLFHLLRLSYVDLENFMETEHLKIWDDLQCAIELNPIVQNDWEEQWDDMTREPF
jgi:hypothetical protein